MNPFRSLAFTAALAGLLAPSMSAARPEVTAVLSSDLAPYVEALEGFRETIGVPFTVSNLNKGEAKVDAGTRVVVAFGGKAALANLPPASALIYCMTPGLHLTEGNARSPRIRVLMLPRPAALLARLKEIQPELNRIAVFWSSDAVGAYVETMRDDAARAGLELLVERLEGGRDLPSGLRRMIQRKPDALWLPPDPLLVNLESFAVLRSFTRSNRIPFYAPSDGLVERGASAAVSCDFREIGRTAGRAARLVLAGKSVPAELFPERILMSFNVSAAASSGLRIPADLLQRADRIYP